MDTDMQKSDARLLVRNHIKKYEYHEAIVSEHMVRFWWRVFNISLFDASLPYPKKVIIKNFHSGFLGYTKEISNENNVILGMRRTYFDKKLFLTTLVHEMVHQYQQVHFKQMSHGDSFYAFAPKVKEYYGLELSELIEVG